MCVQKSTKEVKEINDVEIWIVSWISRYGDYHFDVQRCAKAFLTEEDAKNFKNLLEESQQILQNTNDINITIIKQK
jgi:hypothetical protein